MEKNIIIIGSSSDNNRTINISRECINNVYFVNSTNWASNDTFGDQFRVEVYNGKVICKRLDIDSG